MSSRIGLGQGGHLYLQRNCWSLEEWRFSGPFLSPEAIQIARQ